MTSPMQTISIPSGGNEDTLPLTITDTDGLDISTWTVELGYSNYYTYPTVWYAPTTDVQGATTASREVSLRIGTTITPDGGIYYLYSQITSPDGQVIQRRQQRFRIINTDS